MQLFTSKPADIASRLPSEAAVYDLLERLEIPYERADHPPMRTMEDCSGMDQILRIHMCKNLFLTTSSKDAYYLLMMPGEKKFKTSIVSHQIGSSRLSFADADHMQQYLGILPGAVSVMGLMNDTGHHVQLLVDRDVLSEEYLGCHPCVNTSSLRLLTADVFEKFLPATGHDYTVIDL
ncbi:MAG: prolyl-tRNA synthetase associated domain-containing protein [Fusicatenibacter sp.]|nr:prolyl-tRNA synthetase associated domain-containing protein [Lachnospiraceae bacterium]MDY2939022.1 prolyl-tRNA synthetase associated domain-containing protein [Fusicatenibacter sp.]